MLITFLIGVGLISLIISLVLGSTILLTTYGLYKVPPLIAAATAVICWIAVTLIPWPKAEVASSTGPTLSKLNKIPLPSPFKSIPVLLPKPKELIYLNSLSLPSLLPKDTNPGLHEFWTTCKYVWVPCPPCFQHLILAPSTLTLPPSWKLSFNKSTVFSWTEAARVIILNVPTI